MIRRAALFLGLVSLSAQAQSTRPAELQAISKTYTSLQSLTLSGTVTGDFDLAGDSRHFSDTFTASFQRGVGFRHEMAHDLVLGSADKTFYAYRPRQRTYTLGDSLPAELWQQNPSLALAVGGDAFLQNAKRLPDRDHCIVLEIPGDARTTLLFDASTHLLRQAQIDFGKVLLKRGAPQVRKALVTIDYTKTGTNSAIPAGQFAWTPPSGWREASAGAGGGEASDLVGKPAPALTLKGLDGKPFTLEALKGSVVVLDFWATWCGPCVVALPHLNQIYEEKRTHGLKAFAIDQGETPEQIRAFLSGKNITLPVVLDPDGTGGGKYNVEAIPQTVIIGKDGIVQKVFVGFNEEGVREAIDTALSGR